MLTTPLPSKVPCAFIFVTGGVSSSVGKGLTTSALASLMQSMGFRVCIRKMDPYLNVDPGTMSPLQHGEVFVTEDGTEADLDLGHYERFTGINCTRYDSTTAGRVYVDLIERERNGEYLGATVQVIPHVTNLIKNFIYWGSDQYDVILCEIGGTVGDIEGQPFFESARQVAYEVGKENVIYVHLTLVPYLKASGELKTKPSQHSVKALNALGIQPDFLICRTQSAQMSAADKRKIALFCNVKEGNVIEAQDVDNIYKIPLIYKEQGLDTKISALLGHGPLEADVSHWKEIVERTRSLANSGKKLSVAIIGKYSGLCDAYISVDAALQHAAFAVGVNLSVQIIDARGENMSDLSKFDMILIPGGFGNNGIDGKLLAITHARVNNVPFLGICFGFQLAILEFARNVVGIKDADSTEFNKNCKAPVICFLDEWHRSDSSVERRDQSSQLGGTMRLGKYNCVLKKGSKAYTIYNETEVIAERHRHRYEANPHYLPELERKGMLFSGHSERGCNIPEILELTDHPWFLGVQFHPEFKSRIFKPHPLFLSFVKAGLLRKYS
ncbi:CTP synthase [Neorickettsia risticii]|uniref:CTP synthase n=1 Tax=Neorickettsia risticii (strain Illinois) TaxID=434131 RepID=C6V5Z3_NEORI|nr:CTP synthase [Neorickettsia risticii]ACT69807.1 CTP synthase [Neorickettsia risticii str. Illinois]